MLTGNKKPGLAKGEELIRQIDALLPQTQCGQCNYPACRPYAKAIAEGEADINQCPPGGNEGVLALAELLGRKVKPINPENGIIKPKVLAIIREPECIGCTKCIQACPVDAIIGGAKLMHTIIADLCTGCELCIPPCPMDCIDLIPLEDNRQIFLTPYVGPRPDMKITANPNRSGLEGLLRDNVW